MALGSPSGCTNHPAFEAVGRCKQCGKPFCSTCKIPGPTGNFCSDVCKAMHEQFTERAQKLDMMAKGTARSVRAKFWHLGKKIIFFGAIFLVIAVVLTYFEIDVPVVSNIIRGFIDR